jgi:GNAT superfamily N-acetyltransferase
MRVSLDPADLAPGDRAVAARDWSGLSVQRVAGPEDPQLGVGYERLWAEFGADGAMERRAVIEARLAWDPARPVGAVRLAYEMLVFRRDGQLAAVRDHTGVVRLDERGAPAPGPIVVHLSHALVEPAERGSGLAAWLRALPLAAARRCAAAAGLPASAPIVLVAEMEPHAGGRGPQRSYERAGFSKVEPGAAPYAQPDFRAPDLPPLPFELVLRRVGRERETALPADELAAIVASIYAVYAVHTPARAIEPLQRAAAVWTRARDVFPLVPPTAP